MAKLPAKKKEKTPEEQAAELAAMTGDMTPISLMPGATQPSLALTPPIPEAPPSQLSKSDAAITPVASVAASAASSPVTPSTTAGSPAPTHIVEEQEGKSEPPAITANQPSLPDATAANAAPDNSTETDNSAFAEEADEPAIQPPIGSVVEYDLSSLFIPTKEKKSVMFRITPAMHQYFQQIGMILGSGASVPDVVHNILTQWKVQHGPQVQKAMQKQLRQMLKQ